MNYQETCQYLNSLDHLGCVPGLVSIKELLRRLGNPQNHNNYVHIAGTNGKGSVGAFLSYICVEAGLKVGRYSSPAVEDSLETIKISNINITGEQFSHIITKIKPVCSQMVIDGFSHPTRFEVETVAAFVYFMEQNCDIVLLECGMGGLLDATNVIETNLCSIITAISKDHTSFLGNTIEEIAANKAGIIKPGRPVICIDQKKSTDVIKNIAARSESPVYALNTDDIKNVHFDINDNMLHYDYKEYINLGLSLTAHYQTVNSALAIIVCDILKEKYNITYKNIYDGLAKAEIFGRFSHIGCTPDFYVDGAHNPAGAMELNSTLDMYYPDKKLTYILGVFADKDYHQIIKSTISHAGNIITIETPDNPRALSSKKLARYIKEVYDIPVMCKNNIDEAVEYALDITPDDGAIIAFGSLSHLKYIKESLRRITNGQGKN